MPALLYLAALTLSACANADPERLNRAAQVILTRSAAEGGIAATQAPSDPNAPRPTFAVVTATPSLIYALCLVRDAAPLRVQPDASVAPAAELAAREIITAYGRTADALWVLGWNKDDVYGWVTADVVGCTVPTAELFPTDPNVLLAEPGVAVAEQPASTPIAAPEPTATALPTETAAPEPTATALPTETAAPQPTATLVPAAQQPTVIIRIITVVVTVTAAPAEPAAMPTLTQAAQPSPTIAPTTTPQPTDAAAAPTTVSTATASAPVDSECVVTPGTPVNLRRGPARTERLLGSLPEGTAFIAFGRNEDATWLYGATPRRTFGWLIASAVACLGELARLPVVDR
jgi:hypothetical protein